ncbi:hypothetical protein [Hasllibacter sp. MH4015]|uniref:hypothetical protein n=1 Tax=Hasllibacter sp. MH4015 TaxID=2854029 RepID=UPI001CD3F949|nr:hypothetical protein [Hasllibacter sp. MH4015]
MRAIVIMVVLATPAILIPGTTTQNAQLIALIGLIMGAFVIVEYAARFPVLIEFRDAPPFNRVRVISLFLTLYVLSIMVGTDEASESTLSIVVKTIGHFVGRALDFPYSPLRLVLEHLPDELNSATAALIQSMAGLSVLVTTIALLFFTFIMRTGRWPNRDAAFNVWINLPTFDPTTGGDVVRRLTQDGRVNIIFGFCSPFVIPVVAVMGANQMEVPVLGSPHILVWAMTIWMFLPLSLIMRGQAMLRIAAMIRARRARLVAGVDEDHAHGAFPSSVP